MKTCSVYSLELVLHHPEIFRQYHVVYDDKVITTTRVECDVSWLRRLFGSSKTEYKTKTRPARQVWVEGDTLHIHPRYRKQLEESRKRGCK
ncbi:hypothetical protein pEaSNUABM5_00204 [Erwinia phage pEa_SNUABM_5]|uniref:Uncharacterized protein n=1 Tax=Erwinia phage pEa_SNUABM_5 TaxID=2797313 RepID=A0A7T8IVR2_9CAUD|nr:hypothetical protein MPK73_gp204 [Erwinia phage pEa_SNUABM_5]QQO90346.1 hypothetical protein pEaSNUABM5_00204 [Erwinia phage pEa_SNUABM_5]